MPEFRIAAIPGDGIGAEVLAAGLRILETLAARDPELELQIESFPWGSDYYRDQGRMMPKDALETLKGFDAIYFGAVGDPEVPDDVTLWGLRLAICQGFDQYANLRPVRILPGVRSPLAGVAGGDIDWIIVRENTEGEYSGAGGRVHRGLPEELAVETAVFTRSGIRRVQKVAFELARSRRRKHLTLVTKSNAQRHGMVLWDEVFAELAAEYSEVTTEKVLVDAMTTRMVLQPASLDVMVASNLHADILSDLAAALSGSLGIAPTANLNPDGDFPSMFEPIHGAGFDIAGKGIANPVGAFWSAALLLEHLGQAGPARALMTAVEQTLAAGVLPPDLGGRATTEEVAERVRRALEGENA